MNKIRNGKKVGIKDEVRKNDQVTTFIANAA